MLLVFSLQFNAEQLQFGVQVVVFCFHFSQGCGQVLFLLSGFVQLTAQQRVFLVQRPFFVQWPQTFALGGGGTWVHGGGGSEFFFQCQDLLFQAVDFLLHGGDVRDITGMSNHRQQGGRYVLSGFSGGLNCFKQLLPQFLQVLVLVFGQVEIGARGGGIIHWT